MPHRFKFANQQKFLQKLALTPQMRQSIQLLGMSVKDLSEYIDSILAQNPFLKKVMDIKGNKEYRPLSPDSYKQEDTKQEANPREILLNRIKMLGLDKKTAEIAEYLIYEMDENGYIPTDIDEAAESLSVDAEDVDRVIAIIQKMDPPGIGARNITECLQIQLKRAGKEGSLEYEIVSSFLNEVAQNDAQKIARNIKADAEKVRSALEAIKRLNPRPAGNILSRKAEQVIPELIARFKNNRVSLELNKGAVPGLKLYNPYEKDLDIIKDPEARKFLKENMDAAKKLIDSLKRREDTICKVASYILDFQKSSITEDNHDIKSLAIKDIAKALDFHPSTISRAVANKYIEIDDKVLSLASLLSHGVKKENGELTSQKAVINRIKALLEAEDKARPLSDSGIEKRLKDDGILINRRTVAKYRKIAKILPAYLRKKTAQ